LDGELGPDLGSLRLHATQINRSVEREAHELVAAELAG